LNCNISWNGVPLLCYQILITKIRIFCFLSTQFLFLYNPLLLPKTQKIQTKEWKIKSKNGISPVLFYRLSSISRMLISQKINFYWSMSSVTKKVLSHSSLFHLLRESSISQKTGDRYLRLKLQNWKNSAFNIELQVGFAIEQSSTKLEVNDVKTKVRRIEPLPEHDETGSLSLFMNS